MGLTVQSDYLLMSYRTPFLSICSPLSRQPFPFHCICQQFLWRRTRRRLSFTKKKKLEFLVQWTITKSRNSSPTLLWSTKMGSESDTKLARVQGVRDSGKLELGKELLLTIENRETERKEERERMVKDILLQYPIIQRPGTAELQW